jgi:hypothetical protein
MIPSTIKLSPADNGEINIPNGDTPLAKLLMIGALAHTRQYDENEKSLYQTDQDGLDRLVWATSGVIEFIPNAVAALGKMLIHCDKKEMSDSGINSIAWLIVGLNEILEQCIFEESEARLGTIAVKE